MRRISASALGVVFLGFALAATGLAPAPAVAASADLVVTVTAPASTPAGSTVIFQVTIKNNGPNAAQAVVLTAAVPCGATYFDSADNGPTFFTSGSSPAFGSAAGSITGNIASLPVGSGASATASLTFAVNAADPLGTLITLTATASSSTPDPNAANNTAAASTTVTAAAAGTADVAARVTAPATAQPGSHITYTITVSNGGPNAARPVTLSGAVPAGTTYVGAQLVAGQNPDGGSTPSSGGTGPLAIAYSSLASGATSTVSFDVAIPGSASPGTVISFALTASSVTSDPSPGNNSATATTAVTTGGAYAFDAWVPVASHNPGRNQSQWRSDLGLLNTGAATANVQIKFHGTGGVMTATRSVPAGAQVTLADVVEQVGGADSGALEVLSDQPIWITARSYNLVSSSQSCYPNGTQGQNYPALASSDGLAAAQSAYLAGLSEYPAYRCNIGLVNTGAAAASVLVELFDGSGVKLGDYTVTLDPGEWSQETQPFLTKANQTAMERGYARVTVQTGSGVFAFASVIDGVTNDPTTVTMQR